jgi:hypothetical protein
MGNVAQTVAELIEISAIMTLEGDVKNRGFL